MPRLSECTDMMLVDAGVASLHELARRGTIFGGPEHEWCWGDAHRYDQRAEEDGEQFEVCDRCHHVRLAPYLMIGGAMVSRHPEREPADPMPRAWPAPRRAQIAGPR